MKLSLNASTIKPTPLLDKIRVAGEAGYDGIELWATEIYEHVGRGGEVSDVEKALADQGLEVPCFIAVRNWGETSDWEYKLALDEARRRFELDYLLRVMKISEGNVSRAAKLAGRNRTEFYKLLNRHHIMPEKFKNMG